MCMGTFADHARAKKRVDMTKRSSKPEPRAAKPKPVAAKPKRRRAVDPREVLESIAGDKKAPAHARVAAARAIIALDRPLGGDVPICTDSQGRIVEPGLPKRRLKSSQNPCGML